MTLMQMTQMRIMLDRISPISADHHDQILRINQHFVHWLAPMDQATLDYVLARADYACQIDNAQGVLFAYPHDVDYPDHQNIAWLKRRFDNFFYIDRIIIDPQARGRGLGQILYQDVEAYARNQGYDHLVCEVNTVPDNPGSHIFHGKMGFRPCGDITTDPGVKALRYYEKPL